MIILEVLIKLILPIFLVAAVGFILIKKYLKSKPKK